MEVRSGSARKSGTAEVNLPVPEPHVGQLLAEPQRGRGLAGSKFAKPRGGATVEALTDRRGKQANTMAEKKKMLRGESFPVNDGDQYCKLPSAGQAHKRITEQ